MDDTNPEKENDEYVNSIKESVKWLGFDWGNHLYFASDYFNKFYDYSEALIKNGFAYVDSQNPEQLKINRGTLTQEGKNSPFRERSSEENLDLFKKMKRGLFPEGAHVLRAKINMASPNLNLRDPIIFKIRHVPHHRQGKKWCIYPLYDFAHPLSDAIEKITHSLCTLEFEDHRPMYNWVLNKVKKCGFFKDQELPKQIEFARLNLSYHVLSKRKLSTFVESKTVNGWNDPRMPTLAGSKDRGYSPKGFIQFNEMIGVTKSDSNIEFSVLEECMRENLNRECERRIAVIDPLKLVIENIEVNHNEICYAQKHPKNQSLGKRTLPLTKEIYIERSDFELNPPEDFFRLKPNGRVRLRYAYVIECTGYEVNNNNEIVMVKAKIFEDSKSGTKGSDNYKVKGNIHWLSTKNIISAEITFYNHLLKKNHVNDKNSENQGYIINHHSISVKKAILESTMKLSNPSDKFQFERHGYFNVIENNSKKKLLKCGQIVSLKDNWSKKNE